MIPARVLDAYIGKKILVTGAGGYVGSALAEALCGMQCRVSLLVRRMPKRVQATWGAGGHEIGEGSVSERTTWERILPGADYVFHLAAHEHRHGSAYDPITDLEINSLSILHLLEVCRQKEFSPRIVFASSTNVVSSPPGTPVSDKGPDDPGTVYGINKLMAEKYLQYYAREFKLETITLRLSNVYGPVPDPEIATRVVLNRIISKAVRGGPLTLFQNQACVRDYIFIDDVVAAFLMAPTIGGGARGEPFVIGSGRGCRIMDAVQLVADRVGSRTGTKPAIESNEAVMLEPVEWRNFVADSSRFHDLTGWSARVPLAEGIDRTVDYFFKHLKGS